MSRRIHKSWLVFLSLENDTHDFCVDVFERPDTSCGFESFRRDVEDSGQWTPLGYFSASSYRTRRDALIAATTAVPWLREAAENAPSARALLAS